MLTPLQLIDKSVDPKFKLSMAAIFICCAMTETDFGTAKKKNKIIWIHFLQEWTPGESLNILMYNIATYTRANIEKTANSQVRLDARSD